MSSNSFKDEFTNQLFGNKSYIYLTLGNIQDLIPHKTQPNNQPTNLFLENVLRIFSRQIKVKVYENCRVF